MTEHKHLWLLVCAALLVAGCDGPGEPPDPHAGHDHGTDEPHDDEQHPDDEGLDEHADEEVVVLTAQQRERIGLKLEIAGPGTITETASFPGELSLDPDRITHVAPSASGFVRSTEKTIGDKVLPGETLAWIESAELAEAKMTYFSALAAVEGVRIRLPRTHAIFENVNRLLDVLQTPPDSAALAGLHGMEMGEWRGRLLTAHTQYKAAWSIYESERNLRDQSISSGRELVEAEAAALQAEAELNAARDTARFQVQIDLIAAAQSLQIAEFEAVAAEKKLRLLGADTSIIESLQALVPDGSAMVPCRCEERDCSHHQIGSVFDTLGQEEKLGWYALKAPAAGMVIAKHMTLGERIGGETEAFSLVDTDSLWVQFDIYQKDLPQIREQQAVKIVIGPGYEQRVGTIAFISPLIDEHTRTVKARVVLDNRLGILRPGLFVTVRVDTQHQQAPVVIPKDAVQTLDERPVVFVAEGGGYAAEPVVLGRSDKRNVEILSGLEPGARYVTRGAFELKAMIVTSGQDAHAGHGH